MTLQNVHHVEADIKRKTYITEPHVTANDDIAFIVTITDDGAAIDMASVTSATLASTRLDKQTVITAGTKLADGTIKFELGHTETQVVGEVKAVAQLFDAEGDRISSVAWTYIVDRDPTGEGYIPTEKDKTFIEVVLSEGPAVIQEAKDVTAAAQQSVLNADGATERANAAAAGAESVVDEFATFKSSAAKAKEFPTVDDRFEELEKDGYFPIINLIVNGDFSEGTNGWSFLGTTEIIADKLFAEMIELGGRFLKSYISVPLNFNQNEKVYVSGYFISDITDVTGSFLGLTLNTSNSANYPPMIATIDKKVSDSVQRVSGVSTIPATGSYYFGFHGQLTAENHTYAKAALGFALNLTKVFGAGNEPTVAEMDALLARYPNSWFDGTVNLTENKKLVTFLLNQLRKKSNKQQEAWLNPTLLNGWVLDTPFALGYYKDDMGVVRFKGRIKSGTMGSDIYVLPVGYRPTQLANFPVLCGGGALGFLQVSSSGGVKLLTGNNTYVTLDNVSFRIE